MAITPDHHPSPTFPAYPPKSPDGSNDILIFSAKRFGTEQKERLATGRAHGVRYVSKCSIIEHGIFIASEV